MEEHKIVWKSKYYGKGREIEAKIILDDNVGITIIGEDGTYLVCIDGPSSVAFKDYPHEIQDEIEEYYPRIVEYARKCIADSTAFSINDLESSVLGDKVDHGNNPGAANCAFNS